MDKENMAPVTPGAQEAAIRRIEVRSQHRKIVHETLYQKIKKNTNNKRAGGVAQVIKCLPTKCEALSSKKERKYGISTGWSITQS
jgi:hypothetical protein